MRKFLHNFLLIFLLISTVQLTASSQIVISQVYGGGGNSGSTYTNDFIELFNRGTTTINIAGWSVQYASATGTSWNKTDITGSLAPGQYYLIQQAAGAGGTTALPTPDATGAIAMSATAGKVALVNSTTLLTGSCPIGVMDFVGFGTTANCFEGTGTTPAPSNTNAVLRATNGCTDANNNSTDFSVGAPLPRNTATTLNPCSGPPPGLTVSVSAGIEMAEPATNGTFNISLSAVAPTGGITITYTLAGTATLTTDYTDPQLGSITIPAGSNAGTITLNVIDDLDVEGTETIQITLQTVTSPATIATGTATINLLDNDVAPSPYISLVTIYNQDFNTLANTGTSSSVPAGWLFSETGSNANTLYTAGNGSGTSGDTYSFGETSNSERAFGTLLSSSLTSTIGAQIQNNSGTTITKLKIAYTGEQWRLGTEGRTDKLSFQYSLDATSLTNGTWINVTNLDFITPVTTVVGAKNGNLPANQSNLVYTLRNLSIPNGAVFLIRWEEFNASGSDDGLAVDDFSIEVNPIDLTPPSLVSVFPANGATNVSLTITANAVFNEDVKKGTGTIRIRRVSDNSIFQTIDVTSPSVTVTGASLNININTLATNTGYYIEIDNGAIKDLDDNNFVGITGSSTWSFTTGINIYVANFQTCTAGISDGFTQYSVTGAIVWGCTIFGRDPAAPAGTTAFPYGVQINGFSGGTNVPNVDWLISPSFDLTGTTYPLLSFWSRAAFNGLPLQLKVSTDYVNGDPTLATWTDVNGRFPAQASNIWTLSDNINLSAFKQPNVHFAFVYTSTDVDGARWTLDDISIGNSPTPPPPSLTISTVDIQFGFAAAGGNVDRSFTVRGNDITGDITLTSSTDFTLADNAAGPFAATLTLTQAASNNISRTVFVRFSPTVNNINYSGSININTPSVSTATVSLHGTSIDPVNTLEVVNWNIEWFGSTANGPTNDAQQQANVQTILQNIGADIYGLVEVVDVNRLAAVVANMPGYTYMVSNFGSHTNTSANPPSNLAEAQKLAFVYKTSIFSNVTTQALLSQGINTAADITNPAYNYFASGRFPYMLTADVTLNGITQNVRFVLVHAKANTSPTITSYNRRKASSDTLQFTLNSLYPNDKIVFIGDFNDDLDSTITAGINPRITSYSAFTNDNLNFFAPTLTLSLSGKKSTVSYNDVIDHAVISNEMKCYYMSNTANILTDVATLVSNFASTTSDHYPVFTRYSFNQAPSATISYTGSPFCNTGTGTVTITGTSGGTYSSTTGLVINSTSGDINLSTSTPGTYTVSYTLAASGDCPQFVATTSVTINAIPNVVATPSSQTICSAGTITTIALNGSVSGTSYAWTRNNTATVTGIVASGSGNISGSLTNTTSAPVTVTFTITPTANGCTGASVTATVVVNPIPNAVATPTTQTICSGTAITTLIPSGNVTGTVFNWTRDNTVNVTGIATSGNGNISGTLTNNTTGQQTVTFTITPSYTNAGVTCTGTPITATVIVNKTPTIVCPSNITVASTVGACTAIVTYAPTVTGSPTPTLSYVLTGATTGSGSSSGSGTAFRVGITTVTITATNTCGTASCSFTVSVTDSQLPVINVQPANRTVCVGASATFSVTAVTLPSAGGSLNYQWQLWDGNAWNNITGANASTYTVSNTTLAMNTNSFRVVVTGLCSVVTSTHATLYVNPLPTINLTTSIPPNLLPTQVLTITATTAPSGGTYVWYKNGVVIAGANGSTLSNLTVSDIGTYRVVYTDPNGCVATSSNVVITGQPSQNLYVYPVPNNGIFNIRLYNQSSELVTVRIVSANGSEIYNRKVQTTLPYTTILVDVTTNKILTKGIYIVELRSADGQQIGSKSIIIK